MAFIVLRSINQLFYRMSLSWNLPDVFLMIKIWVWVFWRKNTKKYHSYHILSRLHMTNITYHWWCWPRLFDLMFIRFLHCKITLLFPIPHCILWKDVTRHGPYSKDEQLCSIFLNMVYVNYLEFFWTGQLVYSLSSTYSISIRMDSHSLRVFTNYK